MLQVSSFVHKSKRALNLARKENSKKGRIANALFNRSFKKKSDGQRKIRFNDNLSYSQCSSTKELNRPQSPTHGGRTHIIEFLIKMKQLHSYLNSNTNDFLTKSSSEMNQDNRLASILLNK